MPNFYIVDSVKGGCGKTVLSLLTAVNAYRELHRDETDRNAKIEDFLGKKAKLEQDNENKSKLIDFCDVCIVDMDLLGSSMEVMLTGRTYVGQKDIDDKNKNNYLIDGAEIYLNDLVVSSENFKKKYENYFITKTDSNIFQIISMIFASPYIKDRRKFKISSNSNYSLQITPTHFRGVLKKLIEKLALRYKTIVFDMPPNSDPYTDAVFDILLDIGNRENNWTIVKDGKPLNVIDKVSLEIVSSFDASHIEANRNWLKDIIKESYTNRKAFDNIFFYVNDVIDVEHISSSVKPDTLFELIKTLFETDIESNKYDGNIHLIYKEYDKNLPERFIFKAVDNSIDILDFTDCIFENTELYPEDKRGK